ncbi:hypothetical protein [Devosia sp. Root635]|uniref:hypothetical protein n=1 Tax=Devosia sp. Root635 TaxID=1736575 RepID=UPI0006FB4CE9|nr:hypothetical protein [Devosia sp. Root635]KRA40286.1 hypothetical protein ASD80_12840 [Devosia sp. Root635]
MKTLIAVSVVAVMAMTSGAHAGGFFHKRVNNNLLSNITGIAVGLATRDINVLNGNTVAIGNNSAILSGIGNGNANGVLSGVLNGNGVLNGVLTGNGILGLGGHNRRRW